MNFKKFLLLAVLLAVSSAVHAEIICSYSGPDESDSLELTNFLVEGPEEIGSGDEIRVRFTLGNSGDESINFTDDGIYAAVRVKGEEENVGTGFSNHEMEAGESTNFDHNITIGENGVWQIWPSYQIMKRTYSPVLEQYVYIAKSGPDLWHNCEMIICPSYCEDGTRYYGGFGDQEGMCDYLVEECDYGCNEEETDCADVSRIRITYGPVYYVWFDLTEECAPSFTVEWKTDIEGNGTVYYRKMMESWTELDDVEIMEVDDEYLYHLSSSVLLEPDTTYYYYVKSCGPDDCDQSEELTFTTPESYVSISDIEARADMRSANISWHTGCGDEEGSRNNQDTNYTLYIVSSYYASLDYPPWTEISNSSFASDHKAVLRGMIEEGKEYTYYIKACDEYGYCGESERKPLSMEDRPFPDISNMEIEAEHGTVDISWNTFRNVDTLISICIDGRCPYADWVLDRSEYKSDHSFHFTGLRPGSNYYFKIRHCTEAECNQTDYFEFRTTSCIDRIKNDDEYDVDCGGPYCAPCCEDGVQDRSETGVDCGGEFCEPCDENLTVVPASFDWRNVRSKNWVSPVKDQGSCGSCWAFSAMGAIEAEYNIEQNDVINIDLSEQFAVSCSNGSCNGGNPVDVYMLMVDGGVSDEACFPYTASNNSCSNRCSGWENQSWGITGYHLVSNDIVSIKRAVMEHGPLSACSVNWGHCVVLVGWDDVTATWIVKNSWSRWWGNNGYGIVPYRNHIYSDLKDWVTYADGVYEK